MSNDVGLFTKELSTGLPLSSSAKLILQTEQSYHEDVQFICDERATKNKPESLQGIEITLPLSLVISV